MRGAGLQLPAADTEIQFSRRWEPRPKTPSGFWDLPGWRYQPQQGRILTGFHQFDSGIFSPASCKNIWLQSRKEFFSCNSEYSLIVSHEMWAGGVTFGSWLDISKSPASGENINWPLEFFFWNCGALPFTLSRISAMTSSVGDWEKYMLFFFFFQKSTPNFTIPKKNTNILSGFDWLRSSKRRHYALTQETGQHAENICRPGK